ncbi:MAG: helix-turn-helix domain-containing protein [Nitrospira sp.]|nr:helix-turn-helix domain-containing protein [Nitrospira sp.]
MRLLNVRDVAVRLQVKDKTVYAWAVQGKIPVLKINGILRFEEQAIDRWLQACQIPTTHAAPSVANKHTASVLPVDHLIERAKRAVYTSRGETRPLASPYREEDAHGAR